MATYTDNQVEQGGGLFDMAKLFYSWEALRMIEKGPGAGYYLPGTASLPGKIQGIARATGFRGFQEGAAGFRRTLPFRAGAGRALMFGAPVSAEAARLGIVGAAKRTFGRAGTSAVSRGAAGRVMLGRVAGLGLKALRMYWGVMLPLELAWGGYSAIAERVRSARGLEMGGYFPETRGSVTSRQRTVRAITDSRLQARSAIGNEAMLFHR